MTHATTTQPTSSRPSPSPRQARPGFSLVELLTVIFIIVVVIAIVLPALAGVRDAAKKATTNTQLTDLLNAVSAFQQDQRRLPGYFSPREMGAQENMTEGFTSMENMMLDLLGQDAVAKVKPSAWRVSADPAGGDTIQVGPTANAANKVYVNLSLLSTDKKSYYTPPAKQLVGQYNDGGSVIQQAGKAGNTDAEGKNQMPDLVDSFGNPILAWVQDDTANLRPVSDIKEFAAEYDQTTSNQPAARFYWAQNAGFLKANNTGKANANQETQSMLGEDVSATDRQTTLMALLGNPSTPVQATATLNADQILAGSAKGRVMLHSAGKDGIFLKKGDKQAGRGLFKNNANALVYGIGLKTDSGTPQLDATGKPAVNDVLGGFDDLTVAGAN